MNRHQKNLIRREAYVQGFVAARDPKDPHATLRTLEEAERAFGVFLEQRENGGNTDKEQP